jgi:autotransporter-associated beta strand protein
MNQTALLLGFMCQSTACARRHTSKLFTLVVLALLAQLAIVPWSPAATLIFDGNTGTTGAQDGSGNWDTTTTDWWNGTSDVAWDNTTPGNAVFGVNSGAAGTITVGSGINIVNITNNSPGSGAYTIGGNPLTLAGNPTIYVATGTAITMSTVLNGTGYTLEGGGWLTNNPGGNNTYSGTTIIDNGGLVVGGNDSRVFLPGDVIVNANGTLMFSSGSATGGILGGNKVLILNGGVLFGTSNSKYLPVSKIVMDNGGQMQGLSITIMTNLDARSGLVGGGKGVGRYVICTLAKSTAGTLTITNQMYSTGVGYSNVTLNAGLLVLDKSVEKTASKITGPLIFAGGTLILTNGNGTAAGGESKITATTVNPGASAVKSWTGAGATAANAAIALTAITRQVGGTLDTETNNTYANTITTTTANNNGILGGWATYKAADWAVGAGSTPFLITALAAGSYQADLNPANWGSASNVTLNASTSSNVGDGTNINSLRLTAASTVTLNGTLTLTSGGLLVTGSDATAITNGTLKGGSGADLIVHQYASADLTISSTLADNGSASSLTKSGTGKLIISGTNNLTGTNYLNAGVVEVSDLGKLASGPIIMTGGTLRYTGTDVTDTRTIMLNGLGGTFDVSSSSTTLTVPNNLNNSDGIKIVNATAGSLMGNWGGLTKMGAGKLVLTGSNYYNGLTVVSNGTLLVNGTNTYDTTTFNAGKVAVYGGVLGGTGKIMGLVTVKNGGTISPGASIGTLTLATNLILESGSTSLFEESNSVAGDLLQVQGNLTIQPNCTIDISVLGAAALAPVTNTLITYTGTKSGSFNSTPVIVGGAIDGSYTINDSTPGQINLVVTPQVTITSQPSGTNIVDGQAFSLSVSATGTAPVTYQWYITTDTNNPGGTTMLLTGANGSSYSVSSASSSDNGYYSVVITNNYNSVTSLFAYVHVAVTPPALTGPTNQTVIAGNNATLAATLTAGAPAPTYQWYFGATPLIDDGVHISGSTSLSLTITNVQNPADQGTYSIVASNVAGTFTNSATLTVIVPPVIYPQPTKLTVNQGDTANFVSGATGIPAPGLQWYKNSVGISGQTSGTLTIVNAQGSDVANYYLVATNVAGSATSSVARLTVVSTNLAATTLAPANGATGVCYDTPLYVTFNGPISIQNSGKIRIYSATNSVTPVDTIDMSSNTVIVSTLNSGRGIYLTNNIQAHSLFQGDSTPFNYFPVIITGTTAAIYPHSGVLTSNQTYYVMLESGIVNDSGGAQYAGISDTNAWRFTTKPGGPANPTNLVVAADGSGDFVTVQGAVDSIPLNNNNYTLINIHDGNYVELVDVASKTNITLRGQSRTGTIISYGNNLNIATGGGSTHSRMSFKVASGSDIKVENLTLVNSTPQGGSQAEALMLDTGVQRFILNNCEVRSFQDTILANVNSSQGYFYNSTIKGNYDYVWGGGNLFFTNCTIITVSNIYVTNNYNLNAARTDFGVSNATDRWLNPAGSYTADGFSYVNCKLLTDPTVTTVTLEGANGTANGLVAFINCCIDTNHYVAPGANIMTNYLLWQYGNDDVTCTYPVDLGLTNLLGGSDPRLLAAENATNWLYGWAPALAPNIIGQPANATVSHGQSTNFSVSATGIPEPTFQWYQNGLPIPGAIGNNYSIASAVRTNGGNYTVVVSNGSGSVTSIVATLTYNNTAPVANPSTYSRPAGYPLNIIIAGNLATNWSDADGDPLALTSGISSTNAATVSYDSSYVYYTNANDVADQINYTVGDGQGGTAASVINVVVGPPPTNSIAGTVVNGNGSVTLSFVGVPDYTYLVEATLDLMPPVVWTPVSTNTADINGLWQFTDTQATNYTQRFYRSVYWP